MKKLLFAASILLAILTLTNCGEIGCDPTLDSWCEEGDSSSGIGGSSSSGGGLPLSSSGGNSSSSVGGGSSSSNGGLPSSSSGGNSSSSVGDGSSSSVGGGNVVYGEPVNYGGETYPTVVIGTQTWFAKNLNYIVEGSKCYDDDPANCTIYGRLYDWATAMALDQSCIYAICSDQIQTKHKGVCPVGWHLPSENDWRTMAAYIGDDDGMGKKLKATSGWRDNGGTSGNGTDNFGFSALPGGVGLVGICIDEDGQRPCWDFNNDDGGGTYWSSNENTDEYNGQRAYRLGIYYDHDDVAWRFSSKFFMYSIRCLKD